MLNLKIEPPSLASSPQQLHPVTANSAFSLISKGWREVRDSAELDLKLMRNRADSFKNLATSFDKEIENFINSASTFAVPTIKYSSPPQEIEFVKKLRPKLSEIKRAYSSPDFSRKVFEKWSPRGSIRIDLSSIRNAIVAEAEADEDVYGSWRGGTRLKFNEFLGEWKNEGEESKEWEPIRALKLRLRELERKALTPSSSGEVFEVLKNSDFMEKMKSSLVRNQPYGPRVQKDQFSKRIEVSEQKYGFSSILTFASCFGRPALIRCPNWSIQSLLERYFNLVQLTPETPEEASHKPNRPVQFPSQFEPPGSKSQQVLAQASPN